MKAATRKESLSLGLKLLIVLLAAVDLIRRFSTHATPEKLIEQLAGYFTNSPLLIGFVLALMPLNWLLESLKWKTIASHHIQISFSEAVRGVLAGVTTGMATPNRVGEFAGRIFMTKEGDRLQLLLLSFISSFCQVAVTVFAGLVSLVFLYAFTETGDSGLTINHFLFAFIALGLIITFPFYVELLPGKVREKFTVLATFPLWLFSKAVFYSLIRYAVYVFQFLLLLYAAPGSYGATGWETVMAGICITYLLVTIIPTFSLTEVLVRGSVAGAVLSAQGLSFTTAFNAAVVLWIINVVIPAIVGGVCVFNLKFFTRPAA
ncbi:MAG TPA: hypothetical protein VI731_01905 [Bacteroidia bacterium]|nr:hypothetical protein [Bacteroidia bacterium]